MEWKYCHRAAAGCFLIALICMVASCATNPVTGRQELMLLSESGEIEMGQQTDKQVVQQYGVYQDRELEAYLSDLCRRMGKLSHRPQLPHEFKVLDASVVNAFAVPGGYIYFTRGILASLNSEAELAGVMGHEIGHVAARHSAQQYSKAQVAQFGMLGAAIGLDVLGVPALSGLVQGGVQLLFLRFSRDNEREADALGVEYASKAGYDASQMADFFETLERMNPGSDRTGLPSWFSTHPSPEDREKAVRAQAREWQAKLGLKNPEIDRAGYLKRIDGLVYGEDPRQGYVADGVFYHPGMRFQFPVPSQWKVNNLPSQVQMISPKEDAVILFSLASGNTPAEAARTFTSKSGVQVLRSESLQVQGLSAYRLISDARSSQGTVRVMSYFIQKDQKIMVLHGLTPAQLFGQYEGVFKTTMGQFGTLTDAKRINVEPDRIRVRTVKKHGTVESALRSLNVPADKMEETVLLNGLRLGDRIAANSLMKVVEKGR